MDLPCTARSGSTQERVAAPSTCTVTWLSSTSTPLLDREVFAVELSTGASFTLEVSLAAEDSYAGIAIRGAASQWQAVMASFETSEPIASLAHGTPHYVNETLPPVPPNAGQAGGTGLTWASPYFIPTHEYITFANSDGAALCSVYHAALHAWSVQLPTETNPFLSTSQALVCLFRDAPGQAQGALGSDIWTHEVRYAIRTGSGLPVGTTLQAVCESRAFVSPLEAFTPLTPSYPGPKGGSDPATFVPAFSLASVTVGTSTTAAIVNAAKIGSRRPTISGAPLNTDESLVLRIFTYTPGALTTVTLNPTAASGAGTAPTPSVQALNALEELLDATTAEPLAITVVDAGHFTFVPQRALTTLQITWAWA